MWPGRAKYLLLGKVVLLSFYNNPVIYWFPDLKVVSFKTSIDRLSSIAIMLTSSLGTVPYDYCPKFSE